MFQKKINRGTRFFILIITILNFFAFNHIAKAECVYSGDNFHIKDDQTQTLSPIHRLYNTSTGAHLYTKSVADANSVLGKYPDFEFTDGVPAFCAHSTLQDGLTPIYRVYNTKNGAHLYTRGEIDRDYVLNKYPDFEFTDGVPAFYTSLTPETGLTAIYRLYNTKTGVHLYTRGEIDRDYVLNKYPDFEFTDGIPAFYMHLALDSGPAVVRYEGPLISVGIWNNQRSDVRTKPFKIKSDTPYQIKDFSGTIKAQIPAGISTTLSYNNSSLEISDSVPSTISIGSEAVFEAQNGDNTSMIFDLSGSDFKSFSSAHPNSSQYRGTFKFKYRETSDTSGDVWAINILPMEQYVWGMGEITGTGPMEYNKIMTTSFRTYGYFWLYESTINLSKGFIVNATPGNQLYKGYDYEIAYPRIKEAAKMTRGNILTNSQSIFKDKVAITPYSSWTDGRTRSFQERWGGTNYPWCQSVPDPYGKNPTLSTAQLEAAGNHMVGLSANGALILAGTAHNWSWDTILKYYFTDTSLSKVY